MDPIVVVEGEDLAELFEHLHYAYRRGDLRKLSCAVDDGIKMKVNEGVWSPPRGRVEVPPYYEITKDDVGKATIRAFGESWPVVNFVGRILSRDVGKRVYRSWTNDRTGYVLSIESDQQRRARTAG